MYDPLRVFKHAIRSEFAVHRNGTWAEFQLAEAETIQGHSFPERATIRLRPDGTLWSAEYESDHGFMPHGEPWTDTKHLRFDCAGRLTRRRARRLGGAPVRLLLDTHALLWALEGSSHLSPDARQAIESLDTVKKRQSPAGLASRRDRGSARWRRGASD